MKILQQNVGKGYDITLQLLKLADAQKCDILAIQEPYSYNNSCFMGEFNFYSYQNFNLNSKAKPKAAIAVRNNQTDYAPDFLRSNENVMVVGFNHLIIVSMYFNLKETSGADRDIEHDLNELKKIIDFY